MVISGFDWDDANVLQHQFTPMRSRKSLPGVTRSGEPVIRGTLLSVKTLDGRLAFVVFRRLPGGLIRVITTRDMNAIERRMFRRK